MTTTPLRAICQFCHVVVTPGEPDPEGRVSHGICSRCAALPEVEQFRIYDWTLRYEAASRRRTESPAMEMALLMNPRPFKYCVIVVAFLAAATCAFLAAPAQAQAPRLTNADLGHPVAWKLPPPSPETLQGLVDRQYAWHPTPGTGPTITVVPQPANMAGPWDWPPTAPAHRLDGSLLSDPPEVYGIPWYPTFPGLYQSGYPSYPSQGGQRMRRRPPARPAQDGPRQGQEQLPR